MIIVKFAMTGEKEIGEWDGRPVKLIETAKMRRRCHFSTVIVMVRAVIA
jgi:hypothetical protein